MVSDLPAMKDIVDTYHVGEAVDVKDGKEIATAVKKVLDDPAPYREVCRKASKELCWERESKSLSKVFAALLA